MITNVAISSCFFICIIQPDSPAELGGKIYEMMTIALGGRWGRPEESEAATSESNVEVESSEGSATEVVEPSEVRPESDPWKD
jgi:heat shock protein beta